jgi:hypothetical protein
VTIKIITRIRGGLGNQLFCYSAARRLALVNHAELIIDDATGFARDREYRRKYMLDRFNIPVRKATPGERLKPFERYRRGVMKWLSRSKPFGERRYLEQEGRDFDERLLGVKIKGTVYLDGYWQSERYFKDVEQIIRDDLRIIPPADGVNQCMADKIRKMNAVALHVRWFDYPNRMSSCNLSADYFHKAISFMERKIVSPHYFIFSDDPEAAHARLTLPECRFTLISNNRGNENSYADLWLMTLCRHFITANSTFSWWGAWLGGAIDKIVVTPDLKIDGKAAWGFKGLIPDGWIKL